MPKRVREYEIRVTAAMGKSGGSVLQDFESSGARAKARVTADVKAAAKAVSEAGKEGGAAWAKSFDDAAARAQKALLGASKAVDAASAGMTAREVARAQAAAQAKARAELRAFDERIRAAQKAALEEQRIKERAAKEDERRYQQMRRSMERERERENREHLREAAQIERAEARRAKQNEREARDRRQIGRDIGSGAVDNMAGIGRAAAGIGKEIAGGLGVKFDIGAAIGKRAELSGQIVDVLNQAKLGGKEQGPGARTRLTSLVDRVSDQNALDPTKTARVLAEMQAKSSDLEGAEVVLGDLGKLASATATDMGDMGKAAGIVNQQLMEMPEYQGDAAKRGKALLDIMRHITTQTADGSVEMSDYASQMGRIASVAGKYGGDWAQNLGKLGALSQMSVAGGAVSAAEAARAAASISRDLTKEKTIKNWRADDMNVFTDDKKEKLKPVDQIIIEYIKKYGANQEKLAHFIPNEMSRKAFQGAQNIYTSAGGGEAGIKAVEEKFKSFERTASQETIDAMAREKQDTPLAKAQKFQNQLERIADSLTAKVLPAMEQLAPHALELAQAFASLVNFSVENPGAAITAAIVASIGKSALSVAWSGAMKSLVEKGITSGPGSGLGGNMSALGKAGAALAITAAAVAITAAGVEIIDSAYGKKDKGVNRSVDKDAETANALVDARAAAKRATGPNATEADRQAALAALQQLEKVQADLGTRIEGAKDPTSMLGALFSSTSFEAAGQQQNDAKNMDRLAQEMADTKVAIESLKKGLKVEVTNMPTAGMIPSDGRPSQ